MGRLNRRRLLNAVVREVAEARRSAVHFNELQRLVRGVVETRRSLESTLLSQCRGS